MKRGLVLFLFATATMGGVSQAQKPLPDPMAPSRTAQAPGGQFGLPDPMAPIAVSPGKMEIPSPDVARAMAEKVVAAVDELTQKISDNQSDIVKIDRKVSVLNGEINSLTSEMNRILEDFRKGMFCNECNRSMTELGGAHAFWAHIAANAANGRRAIPASPEKLAEKKSEFLDKITSKERERSSLLKERTQKVEENKEAWDQTQQGLNLWQIASKFEGTLIQAREQENRREEEAAIQQAQQKLDAILTTRGRLLRQGTAPPALMDELNAEQALWNSVLNKARSDANNRISYYYHDLQTATENRNKEYAQLTKGLQGTEEFRQRMSNALDYLPPFSLNLGAVPLIKYIPVVNGFSFDYQGKSLGVYFKFGSLGSFAKLQSGYEARSEATSLEAKTFLDLYTKFGSIRVGTGMKTTYGPDKTTTVQTYDFSVKGPEKPKPKP